MAAPSGYDAFRLERLDFGDLGGEVQAVARLGPDVFIGCSDGREARVVHFRLPGLERVKATRLGGKRIEQLEIIGGIRQMLVLVDGNVVQLAVGTLSVSPSTFAANGVKGAKMLAVDHREAPPRRIAISIKKKLLLYRYEGGQFQYFKELGALAEVPMALAWHGEHVCVGYRREYVLMHEGSGKETRIQLSIDSKTTPLARVLPGSRVGGGVGDDGSGGGGGGGRSGDDGAAPPELLLAGLERVGIFVGFDGSPLPRSTLTWQQSPTAVAYSFPYVVSMVPNVGVEIRSLLATAQEHQLAQRLQLPRVRALCDTTASSATGGGSLAGAEGGVLVATTECVYMLAALPFEQQLDRMLGAGLVELALALLDEMCKKQPVPIEPAQLREFRVRVACLLLAELQVPAALRNFALGELDPRELLLYFPELHATGGSFGGGYVPTVVTKALFKHGVDGTDFESAIRYAVAKEVTARERAEGAASSSQALEDMVQYRHREAKQHLAEFLEAASASPSRVADLRVAEAVDTARLKLLVALQRHTELDAFAERPGNQVDLADAKAFLLEKELYHVLALLYKGHGNDRQALDVWSRMGSGEYEEGGHDGVAPTVAFLASHSDQELVWIFSYWVLRDHPLEGLRIFTERPKTGDPKAVLPPSRVLQHLESFPGKTSMRLVKQYLEALVLQQGVPDEALHTRLALIFVDMTLAELEEGKMTTTHSVPSSSLVRAQLCQYLQSPSARFDPMTLLDKLKGSPLNKELVSVYSKLNLHKEALRVLVFELSDFTVAEEYCLANDSGGNDVLLTLLRIYLHPEDERRRALTREMAVRLVKDHALQMDPVKVLQLLPDDLSMRCVSAQLATAFWCAPPGFAGLPSALPLAFCLLPFRSELAGYFEKVLPSISHQRMHNQVLRNLAKVHKLHLQCEHSRLSQTVAAIALEVGRAGRKKKEDSDDDGDYLR